MAFRFNLTIPQNGHTLWIFFGFSERVKCLASKEVKHFLPARLQIVYNPLLTCHACALDIHEQRIEKALYGRSSDTCSYDNGQNTPLDKPRLEDEISYQAYSSNQFGSCIFHRNGIMVFSACLQTNNFFSCYFCYYTLYSLFVFFLAKSQQLILEISTTYRLY